MNNKDKSPWALILYKHSQRFLRKVFIVLEGILNGFWLGVLSKDLLHKIDRIYYNNDKLYITDEYNSGGLWKWEKNAINLYFKDCTNLLLLGAGGGREIYGLKQWSFDVKAYECNPELIQYANAFLKREGIPTSVNLIERNECPKNSKLYDGAIIGWGSYMLIQGHKNRILFLRELHKQLKPNSPILISFFTITENKKGLILTSKLANIFRLILQREFTDVGDYLVPNYVHYFTKNEIMAELSESEFELAFYSKKPYGHAVGNCR